MAIDDVKVDMERPYPMDRLVCGDVGFGKTEVAIRAAFKAIQDGKQVAVLAPTTLLATQHGNTFADRFAGYPIRVETLSRFLTTKEAKRGDRRAGQRRGRLRHRHPPPACRTACKFKDLGLLVVDEEQRFGVQAKEAMKKLKVNVDVLTLTRHADPADAGDEPRRHPRPVAAADPAGRPPADPHLRRRVRRAGRGRGDPPRTAARGPGVLGAQPGARRSTQAADRLRELVPEARIAVAHGQMDEGSLEQVVVDFWEGRYDVLVCTTIIESGIDMPTVNTLVVERADLLGLGQMHQLRGRVGRSGSRAYAYLFHPRDARLTEEAYERLRTIGEATDLGSGFKIAMRDLEIRGAGNLLGESQSGHIAAVGYDLYCQMVTEAVGEMKGEPVKEPSELKLDVPTDAFLPTDYVAKEELRLEAYRRLAAVTTPAEVDDIRTEWEDRYGPVPEPRRRAAERRLPARRVPPARVCATCRSPSSQARLAPLNLKTSAEMRLQRLARNAIFKPDSQQLVVPIPRDAEPAEFLVAFLRELVPA